MKKALTFSILAVVLLSVGIGAILYANSQKTTLSTYTLSPEKERVFEFIPNDARYDPEQHKCYAYAWYVPGTGDSYDTYGDRYIITSSAEEPTGNGHPLILVEVLEGELTDCVECQYRCSAYYALCEKYNVEPDDTPVP